MIERKKNRPLGGRKTATRRGSSRDFTRVDDVFRGKGAMAAEWGTEKGHVEKID